MLVTMSLQSAGFMSKVIWADALVFFCSPRLELFIHKYFVNFVCFGMIDEHFIAHRPTDGKLARSAIIIHFV